MKFRALVLSASLLFLVGLHANAQITEIVLGGEIGLGYTIVDLPTALDWDEDYFEEWDQFYARVVANVFFYQAGPVLLGASAGWTRLYYYWVRVPYVPSPLTYEGTVGPVSLGVVGELSPLERVRVRAGANIVIFDDGVTLGLRGSALYRLPIGQGLAAFAGGTADVIFGSGTPVGVGLVLGVDYSLEL